MKLAVISDIHSNIYALRSVLEDIDEEKADALICLGDLVGYGPHPNESVSTIRRRHILCIKGNYDASVTDNDFSYIRENPVNSFTLPWTVNELREENRLYLESLPDKISLNICGKNILFVHGSPLKINEYLYENEKNTEDIMNNLNHDVLICGHTHLPGIKEFKGKIFINPGSVGKPKTGEPVSNYLLLDITENNFNPKIKQVKYDVPKIVKDCEMLKFPQALINSFKDGRE